MVPRHESSASLTLSNSHMKYSDRLESPIGTLLIEADESHLLSVLFALEHEEGIARHRRSRPNSVVEECRVQLQGYFDGQRTEFDLPLRLVGTPFQKQVWNVLLEIPFGETTTYGAQAVRAGHPNAIRAVGAANGKNQIAIIVPCHRVVGANGKLTGYGGGIERKRWLLEHERDLLF